MQLAAIVVSLVLGAVGIALFARAIAQIYRFVRLGQPVPAGLRTDDPAQRTLTLAREFFGHTRMNRWGIVGFAHWFVAVGFFTLVLTLVHAFGQLFQADWTLPLIGTWAPYEVFTEFIGLMTTLGILTLIVIRQLNLPSRAGRKSRFTGSKAGQAYFVEYVILIIGVAILTLRGLEGALHDVHGYEAAYFVSYPLIAALEGLSTGTLQNLTYLVALIKIGTTGVWMIVVGLNTNMGVAWHRFLAFPNIWFKREARGGTALGELQPMTSAGKLLGGCLLLTLHRLAAAGEQVGGLGVRVVAQRHDQQLGRERLAGVPGGALRLAAPALRAGGEVEDALPGEVLDLGDAELVVLARVLEVDRPAARDHGRERAERDVA
ncbi:MAG TPA: hypothetical protein VNS49_24940, partial [Streptomyces sp.]|nr:hypothetical protein [Streptomyces sp.]